MTDDRKPAELPSIDHLHRAVDRLQELDRILGWIGQERGWKPEALRALQVGWGNFNLPVRGDRFIFGMHDEHGQLVNLRGYMPTSSIKTVGLRGRPVMLWPCPERTWPTSQEIWLVEGEADAIAARSAWPLTGVTSVPGAATWKADFARRLARYARVHVLVDADDAGDMLADRAVHDLAAAGAHYELHHWTDFAGPVPDKYDLTDWIRDHPHEIGPPID
ncbi:MAG: toprim domain-containing protein [Patulibacter sp.]|nr:toprim domain-containing protein [Patulibacter sp.]